MSSDVTLHDLHAVELGELLEFICDWIDYAADDLDELFARFIGDGYTLAELRADVLRFAFLLGGDGHRYPHEVDQ
jgi:hypothetical protein